MYDFVVVGAGLSGVVIAERVAQKGKKVLLIDKRTHIGGNCYDYWDKNGVCVHRYGPHLFHTTQKKVWDYLSAFTEWNNYSHRVLAQVDGKKVPLPVNLNTIDALFSTRYAGSIKSALIDEFGFGAKVPILELRKSDKSQLKMFAEYVYEKIFLNYNLKQWGMKPEELDPTVSGRVPILVSRDDRYFRDQYQGIPKLGYTAMFGCMIKSKNINLMLNTRSDDVLDIDIERKKVKLFGKKFSGNVIYTGMIDELCGYKFGRLKYRSLNFEFEEIDNDFFQESMVVNYPNDYEFTRIIEAKHIYETKTLKTVIVREYPVAFKSGLNEPYYSFITKEYVQLATKYKEYVKSLEQLTVLGRLGNYEYYNMDQAVLNALVIFESKL